MKTCVVIKELVCNGNLRKTDTRILELTFRFAGNHVLNSVPAQMSAFRLRAFALDEFADVDRFGDHINSSISRSRGEFDSAKSLFLPERSNQCLKFQRG